MRKLRGITKFGLALWAAGLFVLAGYLLLASPQKVFAGDPPPSNGQPNGMSGKGLPFDPYVIMTCQNLQDININPYGFYYILGGNINCSETTTWNNGNGFMPIGADNYSFNGSHIDGKGFTISNLYINCQVLSENRPELGLFTNSYDSSISNLKITNATYDITSCNDTISNVGGIVGQTGNSNIVDVSFDGDIIVDCTQVNEYEVKIGGLVGNADGGTWNRDTASGSIEIQGANCGSRRFIAGGLAGERNGTIANSYAAMDIASSEVSGENCSQSCQKFGGLVGSLKKGYSYDPTNQLINSYSAGSITLLQTPQMYLSYMVGGIAGYSEGNNNINRYQNVYTATVITTPTFCDDLTCGDSVRSAGAIEGWNYSDPDYDPDNYASSYFDQTAVGRSNCDNDGNDDTAACNAVNTDGLSGDYFKNNSSNPPFTGNWDFANVWQTTAGYPQLRSITNQYPDAPSITSSETISSTSVKFTFDLPTNSGSAGLNTDDIYQAGELRVRIGDSSDWVRPFDVQGSGNDVTIGSLPIGTSVHIRLSFINLEGYWGPYDEAITQTAQSNFILIRDCQDLQNINNDLTANYELTKDIDCSETANWNNGQGFRPIGAVFKDGDTGECATDYESVFKGILDGNNHSISDLYINISGDCAAAGMFSLTYEALIQDLSFVRPTVINNDYETEWGDSRGKYAAVVADHSYGGTFTNIHVTGATVSANRRMGGIVANLFDYNATQDVVFSKNSFQGMLYTDSALPPEGPPGSGGLIGGVMPISGRLFNIHDNYADVVIDIASPDQNVQTIFGGAIGIIFPADGSSSLGQVNVSNTYATGSAKLTTQAAPQFATVGGWSGAALSTSPNYRPRITNSFSHVAIDLSDAPNYVAGGFVNAGDLPDFGFYSAIVTNSYFDADLAGTTNCTVPFTGSTSNLDCTPISGQPNYFFNNSTSEPLKNWDFINIWQTTNTLPVFKASAINAPTPISAERLAFKPGKGKGSGGGVLVPDAPLSNSSSQKAPNAFKNFASAFSESQDPPKSLINKLTDTLKNFLRSVPEPVLIAFPYVLFGTVATSIGFMVAEMGRQARRLKTLQALIAKQRAIAQQRDTFWHLAANYLRAPITLLMGGVDLLSLSTSKPVAQSLGSAVAADAKIPMASSPVIAKISKLVTTMQQNVERIMQRIEGSSTLQGIDWPKDKPIRKVYYRPAFWLPLLVVAGLTLLANYVMHDFRKLNVSSLTYMTQAMFFVLVAIGLYWVLSSLGAVKNKRQSAEALLAQQTKALHTARTDLVTSAATSLDHDLSSLEKALNDLPSDNTAAPTLHEGAERLRAMIDSFQLLSNAENGTLDKISPKGSSCKLNNVLSKIQKNLQPVLDARNLSIDAPKSSLLNFTIPGTADLAHQVLGTVLNNATAFSPDGTAIRLELLSKPDFHGLAVHDEGAGVSKEQLAHMFEPFTKADGDDALRMNHEGLGIDLYLNKLIMEYLGGDITAESEEGVGTTVKLWWVEQA